MSKTERIRKLCNAVKEYRGISHGRQVEGQPVSWLTTPKPQAVTNVIRHLRALGKSVGDTADALKTIQGFKSVHEMDAWVKTL